MAKIDEIKEILNTLRVVMSIIAGVLVILFGKLFNKFESKEFDIVFWTVFAIIIFITFIEAMIIFKISQKTKEIKDL